MIPVTGKLRAVVAVLAASFLTAGAARANEPGWYLGASIGRSQYQLPAQVRFAGRISPILVLGEDRRDRSYEGFGGYQLDRYFALEAGYKDFGRAHRVLGWPPDIAGPCEVGVPSPCNGDLRETIDAAAYRLGARATLPISNRFAAFATLGISRIDARIAWSQITERSAESATHAFYGLGLRCQLSHHFGLRLQWEKFAGVSSWLGGGLDGVNTYSAGLEVTL